MAKEKEIKIHEELQKIRRSLQSLEFGISLLLQMFSDSEDYEEEEDNGSFSMKPEKEKLTLDLPNNFHNGESKTFYIG